MTPEFDRSLSTYADLIVRVGLNPVSYTHLVLLVSPELKVCFCHYSVVKALVSGRLRSCLPARSTQLLPIDNRAAGHARARWSLFGCYPLRSASLPHQEFQLYTIGFLCQDPADAKFPASLRRPSPSLYLSLVVLVFRLFQRRHRTWLNDLGV